MNKTYWIAGAALVVVIGAAFYLGTLHSNNPAGVLPVATTTGAGTTPTPSGTPTPTPATTTPAPSPTPTPTGTPTTGVSANFFGMDVNSPGIPWPMASAQGTEPIKSLRLWDSGVNWAQIETARGTYSWDTLDKWVSRAQNQGMEVLYTFGHTPNWASNDVIVGGACAGSIPTSPYGCLVPSDVNADGTGADAIWQEFVTAIATRYKGKIQAYELWNEQNAPNFWKGNNAQAVRMAKDAYNIFRGIDPTITVVAPSFVGGMPNSLDGFLAAGGGAYVDVINYHGRPQGDLNNVAEGVLPIVSAFRSIMAKDGVSAKPLWDTEGGWLPNKNQATTLDEQIAYVARQYLLLAGEGVGRYYWYNWDHTLWTPQTGAQQTAVTYSVVAGWLIGATPAGPCVVQSNGTTYVCVLSRGNGYQAEAVWDTAGSKTYSVPTGYVQYRDLTNAVSNISGVSVTIGLKPILLETKNP